jgi:hypothetical protein
LGKICFIYQKNRFFDFFILQFKRSDSARAKVLLELARAKNQNFYFYVFYVSLGQRSFLEAFKMVSKIKKNFARARKIFARAKIFFFI